MPSKEAQKRWYRKNKERMLQKQREQRKEIRRWFREEIIAGLSCVKCGESHPATFDFHHRDPSKKEFSMREIADRKYSKTRILEEFKKCEVLCANCHRKHHFEERDVAQSG